MLPSGPGGVRKSTFRGPWPRKFAAIFIGCRDKARSDDNLVHSHITIALPAEMNSLKIGEAMQEAGYLLSCNSEYLRRKNWIQICLMGECPREKVVPVANALNRVCSQRGISPVVTV